MDTFTKGFQKSDKSNSTISYKNSGCGIQATITSGGNEYHSKSYNTKNEARMNAALMATESLGFRYFNNEDHCNENIIQPQKIRKNGFEVGDFVITELRNHQGVLFKKLTFQLKYIFQDGFRDYKNNYHDLKDNLKLGITHRHATKGEIESSYYDTTKIV